MDRLIDRNQLDEELRFNALHVCIYRSFALLMISRYDDLRTCRSTAATLIECIYITYSDAALCRAVEAE
jgi:hypothetical protein